MGGAGDLPGTAADYHIPHSAFSEGSETSTGPSRIHPREGAMRKLIFFIVLSAIAALANAATLQETVDRTFDVRPGATLTVDNVNGRITVASWDQRRIRVQADKIIERTDSRDAKRAMAELKVEITANADGVTARTFQPKRNTSGLWDMMFGNFADAKVNYTVTVPRASNVRVTNTNGRVELRSVSGVFHVETTNGAVELTRCGGTADIETTNGHIRAELAALTPQKEVRLETTNGGIELIVPEKLAATVDAETTNGSISSELPVATRSTGRNSLRGAINGGGPDLRLRTTNGGIHIRVAH
jgi:hypothetical protein